MMAIKTSLFILLFFVLLAIFSLTKKVQATDRTQPSSPINITVSPVTVSLKTDPGKPVTTQIKVRNNGEAPENLSFSVVPFEADATGDKPKLRDRKNDDIFLSWISFDPDEITVSAGEWKTVNVTFSPPADASLSYYFAVQVERSTISSESGETIIAGKPAILMLVTVNSPFAQRELQLESFTVKKSFIEFLPVSFSVRIQNTGNVHIVPTGNIFIDGQGKKDLAVLSLNPNSSSILPKTSRPFSLSWEDGFPRFERQGDDQGTHLQFDFSKADRLRFGKYTAHLLMVYDNGQRDVPIESFVTFWVVPIRLILLALALPLTPALLVYLIMRWKVKKV